MIERKIIDDRMTEYSVDRFVRSQLFDVPIEKTGYEKTPLGERITIYTSAPGLVIGREGANIKKITEELRQEFGFENPQVKIGEVKNQNLSASIVAKTIANNLARFGSQKFKLTGFKAMSAVMGAGAMGVEIRITGKLPAARAKSWRFNKGYLKKTGYVSDFVVDKAVDHITLKTGVVGIKVQIMLPDTPLPDKITYAQDYKSVATSIGIPEEDIDTAVAEAVGSTEDEDVVKKQNPTSETGDPVSEKGDSDKGQENSESDKGQETKESSPNSKPQSSEKGDSDKGQGNSESSPNSKPQSESPSKGQGNSESSPTSNHSSESQSQTVGGK